MGSTFLRTLQVKQALVLKSKHFSEALVLSLLDFDARRKVHNQKDVLLQQWSVRVICDDR